MADTNELAQQIADALRGGCEGDVSSACERLNVEETTELCMAVDQLIFCCECCGWWCDQSEMADSDLTGGDWVCSDCYPTPN